MAVDALISALDGVRKTGPNRWLAKCPAHGDKRASLVVTEKDDGRVLMHCFAGCSVVEVLGACGLEMADLFPPNETDGKRVRRPYNTIDILRAVAFEAVVVMLIANSVRNGEAISDARYERLVTAAERLQDAERVASGA